ncbi:MAG: MMPL family transporter, partial [Gammaproteobacteria bacterium]|nr:MMPL family transporter [Gammaproteobacteria bacterium]
QLLLLGELSGNDDISDFIAGDLLDVQIVVMTDYMSSRELTAFKEKLYHLKETHMPDEATMHITGTTVLWANMDTQVSTTQLLSLVLITGFLAVFLPLVFGSVRLGLVAMLINIIPLAVTLGCMSLLGIKINIATALIGGISLGVVVDDTIHFVTRITQNIRNGYTTPEAVDEAIQSIGKSIVRTTLILVVGFSCMATSNFLPTAHFGIFISLSILLALILDLVCLPLLLKTFPWLTRNLFNNSTIQSANYVLPKSID